MNDSLFLRLAEVAAICDVSIPKAYKMMEEVNTEMAKGGYLVISGRVNKRFFYEKIGCKQRQGGVICRFTRTKRPKLGA